MGRKAEIMLIITVWVLIAVLFPALAIFFFSMIAGFVLIGCISEYKFLISKFKELFAKKDSV